MIRKVLLKEAVFEGERDQIKFEMDQNKAEIEATRIMLEKRIPEEANLLRSKT